MQEYIVEYCKSVIVVQGPCEVPKIVTLLIVLPKGSIKDKFTSKVPDLLSYEIVTDFVAVYHC